MQQAAAAAVAVQPTPAAAAQRVPPATRAAGPGQPATAEDGSIPFVPSNAEDAVAAVQAEAAVSRAQLGTGELADGP
eukprot:1172442-Lingulodinium_polyedra.AAC.1